MINMSRNKFLRIMDFVQTNNISTHIHPALERGQVVTFNTNSAIKQVFMDEKLYKSLPIQRVHQKYEIARVKAVIEVKPTSASAVALPGV